jgi:uncharacterized protein (DUF1778 family)
LIISHINGHIVGSKIPSAIAQYCRAMARTTETVSLTLRPEILRAVDAAAQNERRTRSAFVGWVLEQHVPGITDHAEAFADAQASKLKRISK